MCGITAVFSRRSDVASDTMSAGTAALDHRGPDGRQHWISPDGRVGLGHARLSIIDLSTGDQPIANEDGSLVIVHNGALYFASEAKALFAMGVEAAWSDESLFAGAFKAPAGDLEDNVPEDASLVIDTADGLVLVYGCGHAGIVNTVTYAQRVVRDAPLHTAIGGFHLFNATDEQLEWTARKLKEAGLTYLLGEYCTGIEAVYRIRARAGLTRKNAVVSAVGSSFTLGKGISALSIAS